MGPLPGGAKLCFHGTVIHLWGIKEQGSCFLAHMVFHSGVHSMLEGLSLSSFEEMLFFSRTACLTNFQVVSEPWGVF